MNSGSFFGKHCIKTFFKVLDPHGEKYNINILGRKPSGSTRSELESCLEKFVQEKKIKWRKIRKKWKKKRREKKKEKINNKNVKREERI